MTVMARSWLKACCLDKWLLRKSARQWEPRHGPAQLPAGSESDDNNTVEAATTATGAARSLSHSDAAPATQQQQARRQPMGPPDPRPPRPQAPAATGALPHAHSSEAAGPSHHLRAGPFCMSPADLRHDSCQQPQGASAVTSSQSHSLTSAQTAACLQGAAYSMNGVPADSERLMSHSRAGPSLAVSANRKRKQPATGPNSASFVPAASITQQHQPQHQQQKAAPVKEKKRLQKLSEMGDTTTLPAEVAEQAPADAFGEDAGAPEVDERVHLDDTGQAAVVGSASAEELDNVRRADADDFDTYGYDSYDGYDDFDNPGDGDEHMREDGLGDQRDERANDPQCSFCDDGGQLLLCDGTCQRSFHVGFGGEEHPASSCNPLRMPRDLHKLLQNSNDPFKCPNCLANVHQCATCYQEGQSSSDLAPHERKVFRCAVASCGKFYHPECLGQNPAAMSSFICPQHRCGKCGEPGGRLGTEEELLPCRRCPVAYHMKCMPKKVLNDPSRLWQALRDEHGELLEDSQVNQSLIYCGKHAMVGSSPKQRMQFSREVLDQWKLHYANEHPRLESSRAILRKQGFVLPEPSNSDSSGDEMENQPLAKRIYLPRSPQATSPAKLPSPSLRSVPALSLMSSPRSTQSSPRFQWPEPSIPTSQHSDLQATLPHQAPPAIYNQAVTTLPLHQPRRLQSQTHSDSRQQSLLDQLAPQPLLPADTHNASPEPLGSPTASAASRHSTLQAQLPMHATANMHPALSPEAEQQLLLGRSNSPDQAAKRSSHASRKAALRRQQQITPVVVSAVTSAPTLPQQAPMAVVLPSRDPRPRPTVAAAALTDKVKVPPKGTTCFGEPRRALSLTKVLPPTGSTCIGAASLPKALSAEGITGVSHPLRDLSLPGAEPARPTVPASLHTQTSQQGMPATVAAQAPAASSSTHQDAHTFASGSPSVTAVSGKAKEGSAAGLKQWKAVNQVPQLSYTPPKRPPYLILLPLPLVSPPPPLPSSPAPAEPASQSAAEPAGSGAGVQLPGQLLQPSAPPLLPPPLPVSSAPAVPATQRFLKAADPEASEQLPSLPPQSPTGGFGSDIGEQLPPPPPLPPHLMHLKPVAKASHQTPRKSAARDKEGVEVDEDSEVAALAEYEAGWDPGGAQQAVQQLLAEARYKWPLTRTRAKVLMHKPYDCPRQKTIDKERLKDLKNAVEVACNVDLQMAGQIVRAQDIRFMCQMEDTLSFVLAPFLNRTRYTSYGRHFTKVELLEWVVEQLQPHMRTGDTIVDFSAGANEFVPMLKRACWRQATPINGRAYDIFTCKDLTDFVCQSWFEIKPQDGVLPAGEQLVIGLNPPYGANNSLANKFVEHATLFHPRVIVLIVPPATRIPPDYTVVYEDCDMAKDRSFYIPGLNQDSWNKVAPAVRIMLRRDFAGLNSGAYFGQMHGTGFSAMAAKFQQALGPMQGGFANSDTMLQQQMLQQMPMGPMVHMHTPARMQPQVQHQHIAGGTWPMVRQVERVAQWSDENVDIVGFGRVHI